jgi:outer membrane lipoprotein-sorting protein
MRKLWIFSLIALCLAITSPGYAADPDVMTIINKMKLVHESALEMAQKIDIDIELNGKVVSKLVAGKAQKQLPTGKTVLIVLLEPDLLKGFAYLYKEKKDMAVDRWTYSPAINRIRRIVEPRNAYDSFLDTDFTYADLGFVDIKGEYKLVEEENIGDTPTYKVEKIPESPIRYYSRIITWISKETYLPIRQDFYDISNQLYKRQLFENVVIVGETPVPYKISMTNLEMKSSTILSIKELKTGLDLPDDIFKPESLLYSSSCPIWERVCYPSERIRKK